MSNARYRTLPAPDAPATPTTAELLDAAKKFLGGVLKLAERGLGQEAPVVSLKEGLDAAKQLVAIARLEQRAAEREARAEAEAAKAAPRAKEPTGAPAPVTEPTPLKDAPEPGRVPVSPSTA